MCLDTHMKLALYKYAIIIIIIIYASTSKINTITIKAWHMFPVILAANDVVMSLLLRHVPASSHSISIDRDN